MKRRNFALLAGVGISAIALPFWCYSYGNLEYDRLLTEPELLSHIWDTNAILESGKIYQEQYPEENSERKLVNLLSKSNSTDTESTTEMLQQQIKEDFQTDNMVMLDGWILSKTEARQCALFSLTQNN